MQKDYIARRNKPSIRVSLIGAGNIKYHYLELLNLKKEEVDREIDCISRVLVDSNVEIVFLPDRGVPFEVAKKYKQYGGRKVYGTVPSSDKDFGIEHLKSYISAEIDGKKVIDGIIDTENWYKQDLTCCIFGDVILMLGNSLGSLGELVYGYYLYKLFVGDKPELKVVKKKIHHEVRAGENMPFSVIIYQPFMKEKLNYEIEEYIKKLKGVIYYINDANELKSVLEKLSVQYIN